MPVVPDLAAARAAGRLSLREVDAASLLRLPRFAASEPYWGRGARFRFDDPSGVFGVTYGANRLDVAFAETVLREQGCFVDNQWIVDQVRIDERSIVRFVRPDGQPLRLADLTGSALKRLGPNNDMCASHDYSASMLVSAALHAQVPEADGIVYVSRQLNTACAVALFERSRVQCEATALRLSDHPWYAALSEEFGVELLPSTAPRTP